MSKLVTIASLLVIVSIAGSTPAEEIPSKCSTSVSTINNGIPILCAGQLLFEDNFNGDTLDENKWSMERRFAGQPDYEFVIYLRNDDVLSIRFGVAAFKPIPTTSAYGDDILQKELSFGPNCTGNQDTDDCMRQAKQFDILPPFISSQLSTRKSFTFKFGKVEIRAKMPNAAWVLPQLFLEPVENNYGAKNYQSGQMRVAFSRSNGNDVVNYLFGGIILNAEEPFRSSKLCLKGGNPVDWSAKFHDYTLEWLPNKITVSVDNEEYCRHEPGPDGFSNMKANGKSLPNKEYLKAGSPMAPFDKEFYIRLGYGIGGHRDFPDDATHWLKQKPWANLDPRSMKQFWNKQKTNWDQWLTRAATLEIEYVRVYAV